MQIEIGDKIADRYEILELLGKGGYGSVYLARDTELTHQERFLALKILSPEFYNDPKALKRFENELLITEKFSHDNIVKVSSFEKTAEFYFITMEYIDGEDVKRLIERSDGPLDFDTILNILIKVANATGYAHKKGIIHRDIKPDNVLISKNSEIKVTDFGIARPLENYEGLTVQDGFVGTRTYMSPEQLRADQNIDQRTDIYALGILAFELFAGHPPFQADSEYVVSNMHCNMPIPKLQDEIKEVPDWYQYFIEKCCEKNPQNRFQTMDEVLKLLHAYLPKQKNSKNFFLKLYYQISRRFFVAKTLIISMLMSFLCIYSTFPLPNVPFSGDLSTLIEEPIFDYTLAIRDKVRPQKPPKNIAIIYLDSQSYLELGANLQKPFPRHYVTKAFSKLRANPPKALIIDMIIPDITKGHLDKNIEEYYVNETTELTKMLADLPTYIAKTKSVTLQRGLDRKYKETIKELTSASNYREVVQGEFYVNLHSTKGVIRHFYRGRINDYQEAPMANILLKNGENLIRTPQFNEFINYYGPIGTIPTVSLYQILSGEVDTKDLENKYVFFGRLPDPTANIDRFLTPFGERSPGVNIHATILANILENEWIKRLPIKTEMMLLFFITSVLCFLLAILKSLNGFYLMIGYTVFSVIIKFVLLNMNFYFPGIILLLILSWALFLIRHLSFVKNSMQFLKGLGFD